MELPRKTAILFSLFVLMANVGGCQRSDQERSKQQSEKEAKVRQAVDQVAASADRVVADGMRTAEEMRREVVKLAERAKADALSYKNAGAEIENTLHSSTDQLRAGFDAGKETIRAQVHAAAKAVEESTRPKSTTSRDGFSEPSTKNEKSKRF